VETAQVSYTASQQVVQEASYHYYQDLQQEVYLVLTGGGGATASGGGGVQGPLATINTAEVLQDASTVSGSAVTSGTFRDSVGVTQNVTSNTSGPVGII
jgi:hypothetical protein